MSADDYHPFIPNPPNAKIAGPTARAHAEARTKNNPRAQGLLANWEKMLNGPFRGITTDGHVIPDLYAPRPEGAPTLAMIEAANALLAAMSPEQRKTSCFAGRFQPMAALAEHRALSGALRAAPRRDQRAAARRGAGGAARQHEPARLRARARRDEAQPLPRRHRARAGGDGRMELHLLPVRRAVGDRAVGLAVVRPSPGAELLRAGPADGADAGVLGRRAELRRSRAVQGHPAVPGRGARRPEADARVLAGAAEARHRRAFDDGRRPAGRAAAFRRQPASRRRVPRQPRGALRGLEGRRAVGHAAPRPDGPGREISRRAARRAARGAHRRGREASAGHAFLLDRRVLRRTARSITGCRARSPSSSSTTTPACS